MKSDEDRLSSHFAPEVDDLRLRRIRGGILARTATTRRRRWREPREWLPVAAGVLLALGLTWAVETSRPVISSEVNPVVALLDAESSGMGVW